MRTDNTSDSWAVAPWRATQITRPWGNLLSRERGGLAWWPAVGRRAWCEDCALAFLAGAASCRRAAVGQAGAPAVV